MRRTLFLLGDINFLGVADATHLFDPVKPRLAGADFVFANLECCLFDPPADHAETRGFYAPARHAAALAALGVDAVGTANNVNVGPAADHPRALRLRRLGRQRPARRQRRGRPRSPPRAARRAGSGCGHAPASGDRRCGRG